MVISNSNKNDAKTPEDALFEREMADLFRGPKKIFNKDNAASQKAVERLAQDMKHRDRMSRKSSVGQVEDNSLCVYSC